MEVFCKGSPESSAVIADCFRRERLLIVVCGSLSLLGVVSQLPVPLITRHVIDVALPQKNIHALTISALTLLAFAFTKGSLDLLHSYCATVAREKIVQRIELAVLSHLQKLGLSFFANTKSGYLVGRVTADSAGVGMILSNVAIPLLRDLATLVMASAALFWFEWHLALASLAILPVLVLTALALSPAIRRRSVDHQEAMAEAWDSFHQGVALIKLVMAYQAEGWEVERVRKATTGRRNAVVRLTFLSALSGQVMAMIAGIGPLIVLCVGGAMVSRGTLTLGTLLAFNVLVGFAIGPAQRLASVGADFQLVAASLQRVYDLLDTRPVLLDPTVPKPFGPIRGSVAFERVWFAYESDRPVLKDVSFEAHSGEVVAIVGRNGAGKTSLVDLVARFYDVQDGCVRIDSTDVRDVRQSDLRRCVSVVPQDSVLVSGTVRDNIAYGSGSVGEEAITEAARAASAYDFVMKLPNGFDSQVGERGIKLSGGQRQRIAIARAILRNTRILILDEATSEIDAESERLIQQGIGRLFRNRTTFVIAHRFATVLEADKILVLDDGVLVDAGRHDQLVRRCAVYRDLCHDQFIDSPVASIEETAL